MSRQARDPVSGSWMPIAGYPEIDAALDIESINPIQNQAVANPIEAIVNVYGSKNLLPNNATSQVINGVTFTVNSDGSITANGTATANVTFEITGYNYIPKNFTNCILSGCIGGSSATYRLYMNLSNNGSTWANEVDCYNGELTIPDTYAYYQVRILINSGNTVNNLTFKPMIRDSRITDPTYVPYAMTNRELTEGINNVIRHPNFTNVLKTFSGGSVESYTPTVDAWVIGNVKAPASNAGYVNLGYRMVAWTNSYCGVCVPVKAGVTINVYTDSSQHPVVYASY